MWTNVANTLFQLWVVHPKFNYILCKGEHLLEMEREEIILTQKYFPHSRSRSCGQSFKLNIESPCDGCGSGSQYPIRLSLLLSSSQRPGECRRQRDTLRLRPWRRRGWLISLTRCWMSIKKFAPPWQSCQQIFLEFPLIEHVHAPLGQGYFILMD